MPWGHTGEGHEATEAEAGRMCVHAGEHRGWREPPEAGGGRQGHP